MNEHESKQIQLESLLETLRKGRLDIRLDNAPISIGKKLGGGGSKDVYDATIEDNAYALAVPNHVDSVGRMLDKWTVVLKEPGNTQIVRDAGLLTNPVCEVLPTSINGVQFSSLKMKRYQDLPWEIRDRKNPTSSTGETVFIQADKEVTEEDFVDLFSTILDDLALMIAKHINVGSDSINVAVDGRVPRIYLNDLGNASFEPIAPEKNGEFIRRYTLYSFDAFINALSEEEYQRVKPFVEKNHEQLIKTLESRLTERLSGMA